MHSDGIGGARGCSGKVVEARRRVGREIVNADFREVQCTSAKYTAARPQCEPASQHTLGYQRRALDPSKKACDTHCYCFCYNFAPKREISGDGGTLSPRFPWDFEHAQNLTVEKGASLRYGMLWYSTSPGCRSGCHHELCSTVSRLPDAGSALIEDLANAQLFTVKISN